MPENPKCPPMFSLGLFDLVGEEGDLDLLDVVAIEEKLDAAKQRLAAVDFHEAATSLRRRPGGAAVTSRTLKMVVAMKASV